MSLPLWDPALFCLQSLKDCQWNKWTHYESTWYSNMHEQDDTGQNPSSVLHIWAWRLFPLWVFSKYPLIKHKTVPTVHIQHLRKSFSFRVMNSIVQDTLLKITIIKIIKLYRLSCGFYYKYRGLKQDFWYTTIHSVSNFQLYYPQRTSVLQPPKM